MDGLPELNPEVVQELKAALKNNNEAAVAKIKEYLERQNNIQLKIGITGQSGSGKSSFVNAFRGVADDDEGAAPTGSVETTTKVTEYPHPNFPNVTLCDLPGVGALKFPADEYLKLVEFDTFDFFIIISADRFTENDVKLAKEIQKLRKKFYFVRSKIDNDILGEKRKKGFNEERTLEKIRVDCTQGLKEQGSESPQVFLVSIFDLNLYEFSLLQETLKKELPAHKGDVLLLASPCVSPKIINEKKKAFMTQRWYYTALSGVVAAAPVPGLSVGVDLCLLAAAATQYVVGFGLDPRSLERLAARSGVPYEDLCAVIKSPLAAVEITNDLIQKVAVQLASRAALIAAEEASRFIPIFGSVLAMSLSAVSTYRFLKLFLDTLSEDALRVSERVSIK